MKSIIAIFFSLLLCLGYTGGFTDPQDSFSTCMETGEQKEKGGKDTRFEAEDSICCLQGDTYKVEPDTHCPLCPPAGSVLAPVLDKQTPPPDASC